MVVRVKIHLPPVAKYQADAIFCPQRFSVIEATTKAGKTAGCIWWLLMMASQPPRDGCEYWWVAPIYEQAKIAYRRFCRMLAEQDPRKSRWKSNETELSITLANTSVIRFKSADKPDGLFGEDVCAAAVDEASRCKEEAWHALFSTLTAVNGYCRIIGNVKGQKNWAYKLARRVQSGDLKDDPAWHYAKIRAADAVAAGILTQKQVDAARKALPEDVFRELYEAEATEDGSNPFGLRYIDMCTMPMTGHDPVVFGVDVAQKADWTVVIGLDASGKVCVFDRWQHASWEHTEERIIEHIKSCPVLIDQTGVGAPLVENLRKRLGEQVEGFTFTNRSKQELIGGLALAIQQRRTGFPEGPIVEELKSFEYTVGDKGAVFYSAPSGMHDDCVCALALAIKRQAIQTMNPGAMVAVATDDDDEDRWYQ